MKIVLSFIILVSIYFSYKPLKEYLDLYLLDLKYREYVRVDVTPHKGILDSEFNVSDEEKKDYRKIKDFLISNEVDIEIFGHGGYYFVLKNLFSNFINYVELCNKYPKEGYFWGFLHEEGECFKTKYTPFEKDLINLYRKKITKENVIVDIEKDINDFDFSALIVHQSQERVEDYFEFKNSDPFFDSRWSRINKPMRYYYSILCRKQDCVFFNISENSTLIGYRKYSLRTSIYCTYRNTTPSLFTQNIDKKCEMIAESMQYLFPRIEKIIGESLEVEFSYGPRIRKEINIIK